MAASRMSLTLKPEIALRLNKYAAQSLMPKVRIINLALENFLNEAEEDARDAEIAAAAWKRFEKSGGNGIPLEEARKRLDA